MEHSFSKKANMLMKNSVKFLLFVFAASFVFACTSKKEQAPVADDTYKDPRESTEMQRTMTDTLAVLYHVKKYLNFLKENQVDSAMAMLYEASADGGEPVPMSDQRKAVILKQLKTFPVLDYQIDVLNMYSESDCEVRYTIKFFEKEDNNPMQNTLQCVINPIRVGYYWYLTIPEKTAETPLDLE